MFLRHNIALTICHQWGPLDLFHLSGPSDNTHLHKLPLSQRVLPILGKI